MDWDIKIFWNAGTSEVPLELQVETTSSSGATGMLRFLSQGSREMDPHFEMRRENQGSSLPGTSVRNPARGKGNEEGSLTKCKGKDHASGFPPGSS